MSKFRIIILTIFPEMFPGPLQYSLSGKAYKNKLWTINTINIRDFGYSKSKKVDDKAYGGYKGLVMRADVVGKAIDYAMSMTKTTKIYFPSPKGKVLTQKTTISILEEEDIIILCSRFKGIDERIKKEYNIIEISIGDYILSGGELAALVIMDSCIRLIPGVIKNNAIFNSESFEETGEFSGMLECPLYTKPYTWRNKKVPDILISGNHKLIKEWRLDQSRKITKKVRPDLIK